MIYCRFEFDTCGFLLRKLTLHPAKDEYRCKLLPLHPSTLSPGPSPPLSGTQSTSFPLCLPPSLPPSLSPHLGLPRSSGLRHVFFSRTNFPVGQRIGAHPYQQLSATVTISRYTGRKRTAAVVLDQKTTLVSFISDRCAQLLRLKATDIWRVSAALPRPSRSVWSDKVCSLRFSAEL